MITTFAALIDTLIYTRSRDAKVATIAQFLRATPHPDRGWALGALTDSLSFKAVKSSMLRKLASDRFDAELFKLSRQHVGETAETVALLWPEPAQPKHSDVTLAEIIDALNAATPATAPHIVADYLDGLDSKCRYAFLKLATGGMRIGVSARLAKVAFAQAFGVSVDAVEEYWHAVLPPYDTLFAWAAQGDEAPDITATPHFRPFMLSHPFDGDSLDMGAFAAEWKWDGIRVQVANIGGQARVYSRGGDDISRAFPELTVALPRNLVLDGELLVKGVAQGGDAASFNALQQRLGRTSVSKQTLQLFPAFVRIYDILHDGDTDLRALPWSQRRAHLEAIMSELPGDHFDLSPVLPAPDFDSLVRLRNMARDAAIEGIMLKRRDSPYLAGRKSGLWYKWKVDPLTADCVMMYAQRGNGKRASFFSDYTFGCWREDGQLLPVGKAYSGFSDSELKMLDRFVRDNTINQFGPVREVNKTLVLEIAFDSIHESKRHKSGLAMRFPRVHRIRTDKPAAHADTLARLRQLIQGSSSQ